jgi:hypothetical protein
MMAVFIALAAVAVERLINRRRLIVHEVMADVGWLTLVFAFIEFAYLFFVETFTLNYGAAARPLWYTEWGVFKNLMLDTAVGVLLIFTSVWLESAGLRIEMRRPQLRPVAKRPATPGGKPPQETKKCDIEWHEAT